MRPNQAHQSLPLGVSGDLERASAWARRALTHYEGER
jgi:hypothetical protein